MATDTRWVNELRDSILGLNPLQSDFLEESLRDVAADELGDLNAYVHFGKSLGLDIPYLATCYDLIVKDTLREQMYFLRHGKYRYSTFDEVAESVYFDDEYMRKYMHGLALTAYLWPNHRALHVHDERNAQMCLRPVRRHRHQSDQRRNDERLAWQRKLRRLRQLPNF
jgi:hypothetical protein